MSKPQRMVGEILIEGGLINQEQLTEALKVQKKEGGLIGIILVKLNYLKPDELARVLDTQNQDG